MNLLNIGIANVNFSIRCQESAHLYEPDPNYQSFLKKADNVPGIVDVAIELELNGRPTPGKLTSLFDGGRTWSLLRCNGDYFLTPNPPFLKKPLWTAKISCGFRKVTVYMGEESLDLGREGPILHNPVHHLLDRILLTHILAQNEGALLHTAGIEINGKGYLFPGKSGAGKSTITRQFAGRGGIGLLSDDRIVVRKIDGAFRAYGTPWPGEEGVAENTSAPLSGIFFLKHGSDNRIKEITQQEALERLLPVASIPWYDKDLVPKMLDFCGDLVSHVPIYALHFKPSLEVVDVLEGFVANEI